MEEIQSTRLIRPETANKLFFYIAISVYAVSLLTLVFAAILLILGLIIDFFNFVVQPSRLSRSLHTAWNARIPFPLVLLTTATACVLMLVGQWYFELLA